ncbi:MAG: hypothetical protein WC342_09085 [Methanoregula sp.]|jgi:predicted transcriptional regulator
MQHEIDPLITENIDEFSEILYSLGFKKSAARILIFLDAAFEASHEEICKGTGMSQCQVVRGIEILIGHNLLQVRKGRKKTRGKRLKLYSLTRSIEEILKDVEVQKTEELQKKLARLLMLCSFVS